MKLTFYTVSFYRKGYPVRYLDSEYHELHTFTGQDCGHNRGFDDPVEACGEFEVCVGGVGSCYLEPAQFKAKVAAFRKQRKQLVEWNVISGKQAIRVIGGV